MHEDTSAAGQAPDGASSQSPLPQAAQAAGPLRTSQMAAYLKLQADAPATGEAAMTAGAHAMGAHSELPEDSMRMVVAAALLGYLHFAPTRLAMQRAPVASSRLQACSTCCLCLPAPDLQPQRCLHQDRGSEP